jgi:hypothetical protein
VEYGPACRRRRSYYSILRSPHYLDGDARQLHHGGNDNGIVAHQIEGSMSDCTRLGLAH